ncbi:TonB-dependent receptor [Lutibacter sp. HS1-25]|uniref:SusC/RagA family TonB-linked outer membrane protein n=1 Tax=Lutibacter sp. HS1-25 TaxID=2485000 RepID=UPI001F0B7526|nr:TonB-dependent receptor [Lutibacter sp. HS1-25]
MSLLLGNKVFAQGTFTVSGVVTEEAGNPLPGVNILEKGTKNGVTTDFDGKFTIKVNNAQAALEISYIGFKTQNLNISGKSNLKIVLVGDLESLDEVVVIGYGSVRKSDLTGAVTSVGGNDLVNQSNPSVAETLTGRMAGVSVTSAEGSPDAEVQIRVRGGGSLTQDSSPLIIVDGFPVNNMSDVSPSNVESVTVLKDASSTAIYGSRGANGVIIITTKSGKGGKMEVSFNTFYGQKKIANTIDVQSPEDFVKWQYEYALLRDNVDSYEKYFGQWQDNDLYNGMKGNNWQKQIYGRAGEVQSYDLGIRGGGEAVSYNFNYNRYVEKTIMQGSDFNRNNLLLALKNKAGEKVDLSFTVRYSDQQVNGGGANEQNEISSADSRLKHSVGYSPIPLPGLTTDDTDEALSSYLVNPFVAVADNQRQQYKRNLNLLGSFSWKIIDDLKLKVDLGMDTYNYLDYRFYGRSTYYANNKPLAENQGKPSLVFSDQTRDRFRNANTLDYDFDKVLNDKHSLKVLVGEEMIFTKNNEVTSVIQGFPEFFNFDNAKKLTTQGKPDSVENYYSPDDILLSFFGRVNYSFKNRYLLTGTFRADGSSKFLSDNQWGYFPSAAVAWKMKEENFLKDVKVINELKLRLSYGEAGNNNIPVGQTVRAFGPKTTNYINGIPSYWAASNTMPNPDLKWETTITSNIGIDFGLFNNRLTGSVEAYKNKTQDLLLNFPVPGSGYDTQYRNMGENQNTGFEASFNVTAIQKENFYLDFSFNIGVNKNKINSLGVMDDFGQPTGWASSQIGDDYIVQVGHSLGEMYGFQSDGRYEVSDFDYADGVYTLKPGVVDSQAIVGPLLPGSMKLKNTDGSDDNLVTTADNSIIGNALPKSAGGFVLTANGYGFDFTAAFNYSIGNDVYNANKIEFNTSNLNAQYRNLTTDMADGVRWTNLDPVSGQLVTDPTQLEAMNANTTMWSPYMKNFVFSDWAVEDGSFLRLNNMTLGYTLPETMVSQIGVTKLRFYATGSNIFIITKYSGLDPEVSTRRKTPLTPGVDYSPFPRSRSVVFGLNLTF